MTRQRDTGTGAVLEEMILPSLKRGKYRVTTQVDIGTRLGGGKHKVDVLAEDTDGRKILISLKWQQEEGTAEQKVPFEVMCLTEAVLSGRGGYSRAYLVLGGEGWKLRDFYTRGGLLPFLKHGDLVKIVSLEGFVSRANKGELLEPEAHTQPSLFRR